MKHLNGTTRENHNIGDVLEIRHIRDTGHNIAWENVQFLDYDQRTPCRKMKESFLIDIHTSIDEVINPRDGTQKDACWNSLISILKNVESPETKTCAH